jgi:hypothetical protein
MSTNLILLIIALSSFLMFMLSQEMVPGMNLLHVIESRNKQPGIYSLSFRNWFSMLIISVPVMLSLYLDYFFSPYRIPFAKEKTGILITIILSFIAFWIGVNAARKKTRSWGENSPVNLSWLSVNIYLLSRILFIICYELYFRGFLFWYSLQFVNFFMATVINLVFYLVAHLHCDRKIFLGCIPMGILLCLSNYLANSVLPAIIIHLCLTIPHEYLLGRKTNIHPKTFAI